MKNSDNRTLRLLFWESTIKCNLNCVHCRRVELDDTAHKDLTTDQARSMIDQLAEVARMQQAMPILVFSGGEPLCRDDIFELVRYTGQKNIIPAMASNGTLIDSTTAKDIKASGIKKVAISLDGATADVHNKLRKQPASFEKALEGIAHLRSSNVPFQINITLTKHNSHQLQDVYRLALDQKASALHIFMLVPVGCGQQLTDADILTPIQYEQMLMEIAKLESKNELSMKVTCGPHYERVKRQQGFHTKQHQTHPGQIPPGHPHHAKTSRGCLAGIGVLFVGHQGEVFPCGYLPVDCGNILQTPLAHIWKESADLAKMRDVESLEGKCGICEYRNACGGCRARAYAATGNYMQAEPFCVYEPAAKNKQP